MFYREIAPASQLDQFVNRFWTLERNYGAPFHEHEHLWADTDFELIFTYHSPYYQKTRSGKHTLPDSFIIGPSNKELHLYSDGVTGLVAVRFWAWGLYPFTEKPIAELTNRILPAEVVFGRKIASIKGHLHKKKWEQKIEILQDFILSEVQKAEIADRTVYLVGTKILSEKGKFKISELMTEFNLNSRQLERMFRMQTGLSPKVFSRIVRFNHAKRLILQDPTISLAQLTCDAGYYDQAHFSKTFKEMFGLTPATFKAKLKEWYGSFSKRQADVEFLQDR